MSDKKITQLTELTVLDNADLFVVVDDVAGTATTKKITAANLLANAGSAVDSADNIISNAVFG